MFGGTTLVRVRPEAEQEFPGWRPSGRQPDEASTPFAARRDEDEEEVEDEDEEDEDEPVDAEDKSDGGKVRRSLTRSAPAKGDSSARYGLSVEA